MTDTRKELLQGLKRLAGPRLKLPAKYDRLTPAQRREVREAYIKAQEGKCWFCQSPLDGKARADIRSKKLNRARFPEGFFDHPTHLHHDHITGLTIGATHAVCNAVLWSYHQQ
jgi:hypothetical protein